LIEDLNWRYATKKFDPEKKLTGSIIEKLKEATRLSASSYGLQPYQILIIEDKALRMQLLPHTYNQNQVVDASHLFIFCHYINLKEDHIDQYIKLSSKVRNTKMETLKGFADDMKSSLLQMNTQQSHSWMSDQAFIALGQLINICAHLKVDACPMGGFSADGYEEILKLSERNLKACVIMPVGYRSEDDPNQFKTKVRKSTEELFIIV